MKNYTITVNGNVYDVTVERLEAHLALQHRSVQHPQHRHRLLSQLQLQAQEASRLRQELPEKYLR